MFNAPHLLFLKSLKKTLNPSDKLGPLLVILDKFRYVYTYLITPNQNGNFNLKQ